MTAFMQKSNNVYEQLTESDSYKKGWFNLIECAEMLEELYISCMLGCLGWDPKIGDMIRYAMSISMLKVVAGRDCPCKNVRAMDNSKDFKEFMGAMHISYAGGMNKKLDHLKNIDAETIDNICRQCDSAADMFSKNIIIKSSGFHKLIKKVIESCVIAAFDVNDDPTTQDELVTKIAGNVILERQSVDDDSICELNIKQIGQPTTPVSSIIMSDILYSSAVTKSITNIKNKSNNNFVDKNIKNFRGNYVTQIDDVFLADKTDNVQVKEDDWTIVKGKNSTRFNDAAIIASRCRLGVEKMKPLCVVQMPLKDMASSSDDCSIVSVSSDDVDMTTPVGKRSKRERKKRRSNKPTTDAPTIPISLEWKDIFGTKR